MVVGFGELVVVNGRGFDGEREEKRGVMFIL